MPYQFENRYTLTDEMILEYVSQVCCKSLLRGCFLVFRAFNPSFLSAPPSFPYTKQFQT